MLAIGLQQVESHNLALRHLFYAALADIASLRLVSPPPGPLATALVAAALPPDVDSKLLRVQLHDGRKIVLKMAEKRWFNGIRFSPHIFNIEADVGRPWQRFG